MRDPNKSPLAHCYASVLHSPETNKIRSYTAKVAGSGTGNDIAYKKADDLKHYIYKISLNAVLIAPLLTSATLTSDFVCLPAKGLPL